jgi:hypothetical protein
MILNIISINIGSNTITVSGDYTTPMTGGVKIQLFNGTSYAVSPAPDGLWTAVSSILNSGNTDISIAEVISTSVTATQIISSIYEIKHTDNTIPAIFIFPETVDGTGYTAHSTDLMLNGKGSMNYGDNLLTNMVHIMEHFANTTAPTNPVVGQFWYDLTDNAVKIWTGTTWNMLVPTTTPYDLYASFEGIPSSARVCARFVCGRNLTMPAALVGSRSTADIAATASTVFTITKNGTQFGSITYAAGSITGVFTGSSTTFVPGDKISIIAPIVPDTTLSSLSFVLVGDIG